MSATSRPRLLYDINVVLDVLLAREPHLEASARALDLVPRGVVDGYIAAHAVTTIFYLVERAAGPASGRQHLATILSRLKVAPVDDAIVRQALASPLPDFEDAVTAVAAKQVRARVVVTRNGGDFDGGPLAPMTPAAALAAFAQPR